MNDIRLNELNRIVSRLQAGDEDAREQLIQFSFERLRKLARKMLNDFPAVRRWEETDDVFQRSTVRLWEALKVVQPESTRHFFNLAALQVRRELIELARSLDGPLGINKNQESVDVGNPNEQPRVDEGSDTHEASSLANWTDFHESIWQLSEEERETFELIWYQGLSQQTVAEMVGVSQRTVSRQWLSGRRKIIELMGDQLPE